MKSEQIDDDDVKVLRQMLRNYRKESKRIKDLVKQHSSNEAFKKAGNAQLTELKYTKE